MRALVSVEWGGAPGCGEEVASAVKGVRGVERVKGGTLLLAAVVVVVWVACCWCWIGV